MTTKPRDDGEYMVGELAAPTLSTRESRDQERSRACMKRMESGSWCRLHHAHKGECKGLPVRYGPLEPPPDRKLMADYRRELSEKYDDKIRNYFWTDRHGESVKPGFSPAMWWEACAMTPPFDR